MNEISARESLAAAPTSTVKRAPESLAARSKSRMPSPVPMSQWDLGVNENEGLSPQVRTTWLSSSSLPSGTVGSGTLGTTASLSWTSASTSASAFSASLISAESCFKRSRFSANSGDFLSALAMASFALLRSDCLASTAPMSARRFLPSSAMGARVSAAAADRRRRPACTSSRWSMTWRRSSMRGGVAERGPGR